MGAAAKRAVIVIAAAAIAAAGVVSWVLATGDDGPAGASRRDPGRRAGPAKPAVTPPGVVDPTLRPPGSITGRVTAGGAPVAGATVCTDLRSSELARDEVDVACTTTGADGGYRVELLPGGYGVYATAPGLLPDQRGTNGRSIVVEPGRERGGVDLVLRPGAVEVRGVVVDAAAKPIAGAVVGALGWARFETVSRAAADGTFALWVAPGAITLRVLAAKMADLEVNVVAPEVGVRVTMGAEATISGTVIDAATGAPVAGVLVAVGMRRVVAVNASETSSRTDAHGRFRLGNLLAGRYQPYAEGPGLAGTAATAVGLGPGETATIDIAVRRAAVVAGRVLIDGGSGRRPCGDGWVGLDEAGNWARHRVPIVAGEFRFAGVPPGSYTAGIECAGGYGDGTTLELGDADQAGLEWVIAPGADLVVRVRTAAGEPYAGAPIVLEGPTSGAQPRRLATDARGEVRFAARLGAHHVGCRSTRVAVMIGEDDPAPSVDVTCDPPPTGSIAGTVRDAEGRPVGGVRVSLRSTASPRGEAVSNRLDGSFVLPGLEPGAYEVALADGLDVMPAGTFPAPTSVRIAARQVARVDLVVAAHQGSITGTVSFADGRPAAGAQIDATREGYGDPSFYAFTYARHHAVAGPDGRFVLGALPDGPFAIRAIGRPGAELIQRRVATGAVLELVLPAPGAIDGVATFPGAVPDTIVVTAFDPKSGPTLTQRFHLTAGRFAFRDLPPGTYNLIISSPIASGEGVVDVAAGLTVQSRVPLAPIVPIHVRVLDLVDGKPLAGMQVRGSTQRGGAYAPATDADGRTVLANVSAGRAVIVSAISWARDPTHAYVSVTRPIEPPGPVAIELLMPRYRGKGGEFGLVLEPGPDPAAPLAARVAPTGPAHAAGLRDGDAVIAIDGHDITGDRRYLGAALVHGKPGARIEVRLGDGRTVTVTAVKGHRVE